MTERPQRGSASPTRARRDRTRRSRARRSTVSRERVAAAALALIDAEGLDALSMRRLAQELGVGTMTLYHYFPSKDELLDAVVDQANAGADSRTVQVAGDWRQRLRAVSRAGRDALTRHPGLAEIRARRPILRPDALRFGEQIMGILRDAGFDAQESGKAFRLLFTYTVGFALFSPAGSEDRMRASARAALAELPPEYFPALSEAVDEAADAMAGEAVFEYGLERILDGLASRLGERKRG